MEISFKNDLWQYNVEPISRMINELPVIITLCLGGYLVLDGNMTLGVVVAFVSVMKKLIEPLGRAYQLILRTQFAFVLVERVLYILDAPVEFDSEQMSEEGSDLEKCSEADSRADSQADSETDSRADSKTGSEADSEADDNIFTLENVNFAYEGMVEQMDVLQISI